MRRILPLVLALAACGDRGAEPLPDCRVAARDQLLPDSLKESSGAAWSRTLPGVVWSHNDSGHEAVLYGLDTGGGLRAALPVGVKMKDWEDVAVGPCPAGGGGCVYMADTGDSGRHGDDPIALYVAPEPHAGDTTFAWVRAYTARYPEKKVRDAEALFVLPDGRVFLISKGTHGPVDLFQWPTPLAEGAPATLRMVRNLAPHPSQPGDRVTSASASPDGRWVAVRTYSLLDVFRTRDLLGSGAPVHRTDLIPLQEPQGEGVTIDNDGTVALTSEGHGKKVPGMLSILQCPLQ